MYSKNVCHRSVLLCPFCSSNSSFFFFANMCMWLDNTVKHSEGMTMMTCQATCARGTTHDCVVVVVAEIQCHDDIVSDMCAV